jgi:hypothetical protein
VGILWHKSLNDNYFMNKLFFLNLKKLFSLLLKIELKISLLLGKCSTTWAIPQEILFLVCFSDRISCYFWTLILLPPSPKFLRLLAFATINLNTFLYHSSLKVIILNIECKREEMFLSLSILVFLGLHIMLVHEQWFTCSRTQGTGTIFRKSY